MRILLDQGLPRSTAEILRNRGVDAVHTAELGLSAAADIEILYEARARRRWIVTLDADFHAIVAVSGAKDPSVIRIRRQGLTAQPLAELIEQVTGVCKGDLEAGALVTIRADAVKIHRLPVVRQPEE